MNSWQVAKQLRFLLKAATWADSPSNKVFGQVLVSNGPDDKAVGQMRFPFAMVSPLDTTADDTTPTLEMTRFQVRIVARVANDPWGESVLIGGPRSSQGSSQGRGIMELEEALLDTVSSLNRTDGIRIRLDYKSATQAQVSNDLGYLGMRSYVLSALLTADRNYEAPSRLTAADLGSGNVLVSWTLPPARYDTLGIVLRRAAGTTAPATPTDGTGVTVGDDATSVTDTGAPGTVSYSIWRTFNETGGTSIERYSTSAAAATTTNVNLDFSVAGNSGHIVTIGL